jgi:8-oxo-dGTP pyrophosphatase MutT (NUDIX family)
MSETPIFDTATPYIACFVLLRRGDEAAFVLRQNTSYMSGFYGLPAGKVEGNESFTQGCIREAKEEAGVDVGTADLAHLITVHRHGDDIDWVDIYFEAKQWQGEPFNAEPEVHSELRWFPLNDLPENVVPPQRFALESHLQGKTYDEYGWDSVKTKE